jgi:hypothetical protein
MVYLSMRYFLFKKLLKCRATCVLHQTEPVPPREITPNMRIASQALMKLQEPWPKSMIMATALAVHFRFAAPGRPFWQSASHRLPVIDRQTLSTPAYAVHLCPSFPWERCRHTSPCSILRLFQWITSIFPICRMMSLYVHLDGAEVCPAGGDHLHAAGRIPTDGGGLSTPFLRAHS